MCTITITNVFGLEAGLIGIRVSGTVADCTPDAKGVRVIVRVSCQLNGPFVELPAQVAPNGHWEVLFPNPPAGCTCTGKVFVRARCATDPLCNAVISPGMRCSACPKVELFSGDDTGPGPIEVVCNPDGTASVRMAVEVTNSTPALITAIIRPGPGGILETVPGDHPSQTIFPGGGPFLLTGTCRYMTPGDPAPFVEILDFNFQPFGCPPFPIPVGHLPACPASDCPQILNVDVDIRDCEPDPGDGNKIKRVVVFTPIVSTTTGIVSFAWNFGDGTGIAPRAGLGPPSQELVRYEFGPSSPPSLCIVVDQEGCEQPPCAVIPLTEFDSFEVCECPAIVSIAVTFGGCEVDPADGQLKRRADFSATTTIPIGLNTIWIWTFGDGTPDQLGTGPSPTDPQLLEATHLYAAVPVDPPTLLIQSEAPCPQVSGEVPLSEFDTFQPCGGGGPGGGNGSPSWCGLFTFAIAAAAALAMGLTIVLIVAQRCGSVPVPPWLWGVLAGAWLIVGALIILAVVLCRLNICPCLTRCDWLLIVWIPLLAGAIVAFYLASCCTLMWWVGLGLFLAALGTFGLWMRECHPTRCDILDALLLVLVSGVIPTISYVNLIPAVKACGNLWIQALIAFIGAVLAYAAVNCNTAANRRSLSPQSSRSICQDCEHEETS
jgi:hypothetical protein